MKGYILNNVDLSALLCMDSEIPGEPVEGTEPVEVLLARALLQAFDAPQPPFPHPDVKDDEDDEEHAGETGGEHAVGSAEVAADHQQGVIGAVQEHRVEQGTDKMLGAAFGVELGQGDVVAHGDGKEEMGRHGQQTPHEGGPHGVAALHDIAEVLYTGKAEREVGGIDDAVEIFVEMTAPPDDPQQQKQLAEFLAESGYTVAVVKPAEHRRGGGRRPQRHQHRLQQGGRYDTEATHEEGEDQLAEWLRLPLVFAVDEPKQQQDRQDGGKEGDIHVCLFLSAKVLLFFESCTMFRYLFVSLP